MHTDGAVFASLLLVTLSVYAVHARALRRRADRDDKTGVWRYGAWQRRASRRLSPTGALVFLDVDRLKIINDEQGHPVGSRVLVALAQSVTVAVARAGIIGRYGGDEFVILLDRADDVGPILARLGAAPTVPIHLPGDDSPAAYASFGVAVATGDDGIPGLLQRADADLYARRASNDGPQPTPSDVVA